VKAGEARLNGIDLLLAGGVGGVASVVGVVVGGAELGCGARYTCVFVVPFGDCAHGGVWCWW